MDGFVRNIGLLEKIFDFWVHKTFLLLIAGFTLFSFSNHLSLEKKQTVHTPLFDIEFSDFSPAFAAFEDEFLFDDNFPATELVAGEASKDYLPRKNKTTIPKSKPTEKVKSSFFVRFDGSIKINDQPSFKSKRLKPNPTLVAAGSSSQKLITEEEFKFGPLAAMVPSATKRYSKTKPKAWAAGPSRPKAKQPILNKPEAAIGQNGVTGLEKPKPPQTKPEIIKVSGGIQLKEGLAFLGSMEISWFVGDYELQIGSINTPDASFEIQVKDLVGDIILSLYDNNDELIGEGFIDLTKASLVGDEIMANIEVRPINWDYAGKVVDVNSMGFTGAGVLSETLINGVNIELYAFNEATKSSSNGEFSFYNWKKSNSRSLAIASKDGYRESIFTIDSKKDSTVVLFDNKYMDSFFSFIKELGIYDVKDKGTVYGTILGPNASGYSVKIDKAQPIYFMEAGFAELNRTGTNSNGLFAFVGLEDGDYELTVEKDGEILDHKVIVVEQGKISPVLVDLTQIKKHLQYYNPLNPDQNIESVSLSFFDGNESHNLDKHNTLQTQITSGSSMSLLDYSSGDNVTRTFVSKHKGLQMLPLLQDDRLIKMATENKLSVENGLIVGFIETDDPYRVFMKESDVQKTIYFNQGGEVVNPDENIAYGFIMGGFNEGLSSLLIERSSDQMILATDLVFSDHQSISVVHAKILPDN